MRASLIIFCVWCVIVQACSGVADGEEQGFVVKRGNRRVLVSTENGDIQAARVATDIDATSYLLHFITMDPNSLFLPVILHSDMVFYVHTGSGKLSWTEENEVRTADVRSGDAYRLKVGAVFYIQSNLETGTQRQKLRIHSIFPNSNTDMHGPATGPYSSIRDMVLGFDKKVLQAAFKVPEEVIEDLLNGTKPPPIIHGVSKRAWEMEIEFLDSLLGSTSYNNIFELKKKKGKSSPKMFNIYKEDKDLETRHGWSTTVTGKKLSALKGTNIGLFMVNLTSGSMMGPHWNPMAHEVAVVVRGRGMVRVVGSAIMNETGGGDMRFEVEEGDIFVVPRFHAMAQMAFNNETFVFMGFSSSARKNHPQFLVGQASVFRTLSKYVLARSFNVGTATMDRLLASQQESIMLGCISCAEEELRILEEEREEAKEREEEEAREREEERRRKEEEERQREEEEAKRQEEERKRREEEEEEEARREEEERKRKEEEEAARQREEEEAKRQEEEKRRREEEEEAAARREEEERKRREEEEEAAARRAEEERKRKEEEEAAKREEEDRRRREEEEEEEEAARREEEERKRQEDEEEAAAARRAEEKRQRQEEEEEAAARRAEEERRREEEERQRQVEEEEAARRAEEERQRQEEEEAGARRAEEERRSQEEEEAARREEEERQRHEEAAARRAEDEKQRQRGGGRTRRAMERRRGGR